MDDYTNSEIDSYKRISNYSSEFQKNSLDNNQNELSTEKGPVKEVVEDILHNDLNELETKIQPLLKLNKKYKQEIDSLNEDIADVDRSIDFLRTAIDDNETRKAEAVNEIENIQFKHENLINEINKIQSMIKATSSDEENTLKLIETLADELDDLKNEKAIAIDRINKMKEAIHVISTEKERNLPKLKKYDTMLKKAYNIFQETESRMDLSLKLKKVLLSD